MTTGATATGIEVVELDVTFRAVEGGESVAAALPALFSTAWPAYRSWFLQEGEAARPSYATSLAQLRRHMPELVNTYEQLVDAVGGGDLEARFLSHWCPPPLFATCSLAVWTSGEHVLVHNYDYSPLLCDTTVLASAWHGSPVVAMSDCGWAATDGINGHGLAVAIAFGGRPVVGEGFGIGLVVRYLLELATDVESALEILRRVPVRLAYNVALVDRAGNGVVAFVSPDRPLVVDALATAGNRQGATEWPEHSAFCATVEREEALALALADTEMTAGTLVDRFLVPPIYRDPASTLWGTVYTAAYDCDRGTVLLAWPGDSWMLSVDGFAEGLHTRRTLVAVPAGVVLAAGGSPAIPAHGHPSFII
jgi:predicted choloylglycine hydrolase